jgi:hypothetical protein
MIPILTVDPLDVVFAVVPVGEAHAAASTATAASDTASPAHRAPGGCAAVRVIAEPAFMEKI